MDSPAESLINESEERTGQQEDVSASAKSTPPKEKKSSFWHFQRIHAHDYEKYISPLTEADRSLHQERPRHHSVTPVSSKETDDGVIVVQGFAKQPPAVSHAILGVCWMSTARNGDRTDAADFM